MDNDTADLRVLVATEEAQSAHIVAILGSANIACHACDGLSSLLVAISEGAGAVVTSANAFGENEFERLSTVLAEQASWSDLVVVVIATGSKVGGLSANCTVLDPPVRDEVLISLVRTALRSRRLQYELRDKINELTQALDDSRRASDDVQQFAYAASHDLQEPLRMIGSYVQLLEKRYKGRLDADADEYIAMAASGVARMFRLISDLLTYSRVGTTPGRLEMINAGDAVLWAKMNLAPSIAETGAEITAGPLPSVLFDQAEFMQLLQNIIGNALKYKSAEPPKIHITAERSGNNWTFAISDNGQGFEAKYADRVFGVFKRLHGRDVPGTGIGLALCKRIVEKNGGRIWAESEVGKGSTFYFSIPAREAAAAAR